MPKAARFILVGYIAFMLSLLAGMLFAQRAGADLVLGVGAGKAILDTHGTPFERAFQVGYQKTIAPDVFIRPQVLYFTDNSGNGKSSLLISTLIGVRAHSFTGTELHLAAGPSWLQHPDNILGGPFEFTLEGGIGLGDSDIALGLDWAHASSAGIYDTNYGRDFILIQLTLLNVNFF